MVFSRRKKSSYTSVLLGYPQIFTDQIIIMQLLDPYSIRCLVHEAWTKIRITVLFDPVRSVPSIVTDSPSCKQIFYLLSLTLLPRLSTTKYIPILALSMCVLFADQIKGRTYRSSRTGGLEIAASARSDDMARRQARVKV